MKLVSLKGIHNRKRINYPQTPLKYIKSAILENYKIGSLLEECNKAGPDLVWALMLSENE